MGERWVQLLLTEEESLKCDFCTEYARGGEKVHLYKDVDGELIETMCAACWKEKGEND